MIQDKNKEQTHGNQSSKQENKEIMEPHWLNKVQIRTDDYDNCTDNENKPNQGWYPRMIIRNPVLSQVSDVIEVSINMVKNFLL